MDDVETINKFIGDIRDLKMALKPFMQAAGVIPAHFEGRFPLKAQVMKGLRLPTVDDYRQLAKVAKEVFGDDIP